VREFYEGEEYSRVIPGAKDKISIAKTFTSRKGCYYVILRSFTQPSKLNILK
jgi:hypothetical protein